MEVPFEYYVPVLLTTAVVLPHTCKMRPGCDSTSAKAIRSSSSASAGVPIGTTSLPAAVQESAVRHAVQPASNAGSIMHTFMLSAGSGSRQDSLAPRLSADLAAVHNQSTIHQCG